MSSMYGSVNLCTTYVNSLTISLIHTNGACYELRYPSRHLFHLNTFSYSTYLAHIILERMFSPWSMVDVSLVQYQELGIHLQQINTIYSIVDWSGVSRT